MAKEPQAFKFLPAKCDIRNQDMLPRYRTARTKWLNMLENDKHHAIWTQIHQMMWNDAVYRCVNEARRYSTDQNPTSASNGTLGSFIDVGYVATQTLAIAKLVDSRHDVISLRRLFEKIAANRDMITRENYVCHDGLPYDPEEAERAFYAGKSVDEIAGIVGLPMEGPQAFSSSERLHAEFDRLSGVAADKRKREDLVSETVFATIRELFNDKAFANILAVRHRFVAHAADEKSRADMNLGGIGVTLAELEKAQKIIVQIAQAIGARLLYGPSHNGIIATPQFDVFLAMDKAFVPTNAMMHLYSFWNAHKDDRDKWTRAKLDLNPSPPRANKLKVI
jgi:hypothetical protein